LRDETVSGASDSDEDESSSESLLELVEDESDVELEPEEEVVGDGEGANLRLFGGLSPIDWTCLVVCLTLATVSWRYQDPRRTRMIRSLSLRTCETRLGSSSSNASSSRTSWSMAATASKGNKNSLRSFID
jgi:hypothetical protein